MGKISETGHVINISNFKLMIDTCTAFGAVYKPSNANLTIANMTMQWTTADTAYQALTATIQNSKEPINEREILIKNFDIGGCNFDGLQYDFESFRLKY